MKPKFYKVTTKQIWDWYLSVDPELEYILCKGGFNPIQMIFSLKNGSTNWTWNGVPLKLVD